MACNISEIMSNACANKFSCLPSLREFDVVLAQLLCEIKTELESGGGGGESILVNVSIPFTLTSATTDSFTYSLGALGIGWKLVAWNWYVNSTPAAWGGNAAALGMYFYYDVEDNVGLQDQVELHTGDLPNDVPGSTPSAAGISTAQPIYFKHSQAPEFVISWDVQPAVGEIVSGFIRLLVKAESTT